MCYCFFSVEFCDEKFFTNGKKCINIYTNMFEIFSKKFISDFLKIVQNPKKINNKKGGMPMYD